MGLLDRFSFSKKNDSLPTAETSKSSDAQRTRTVSFSPPDHPGHTRTVSPPTPSKPEKQRSPKPIAKMIPQRTNSTPKQATKVQRSSTQRSTGKKPELTRTPSVQTRYMQMLLHIDEIPRLHNILAAFFTWILLAGFITFPGTFTSVQQAIDRKTNDRTSQVAYKVLNTVGNVGLLWVAGVCCVIGGGGMVWLWFRWRANYVFLINRIFLPGVMNSLAGFLSTIVNVYTARQGDWSITAKVTGITTGACFGVTLFLFAFYNFWVLKKLKARHARELDSEQGHGHETVGEKISHAAHAKPLEPNSVI